MRYTLSKSSIRFRSHAVFLLAAFAVNACGGETTPTGPENRSPRWVNAIQGLYAMIDGSWDIQISGAFSDPDGDQLTFSSSTTDPGIATATINGAILTISGTGEGRTTGTLTATDPGGLSDSFDFWIEVRRWFDFLDDPEMPWWVLENADPTYDDDAGLLKIHKTAADKSAHAIYVFARDTVPLTYKDWTIQVPLGAADVGAHPSVVFYTGHERFIAYRLDVGWGLDLGREDDSTGNYVVSIYDSEGDGGPGFYALPEAGGENATIAAANPAGGSNAGGVVDISVTLENRILSGTTPGFSVELDSIEFEGLPSTLTSVALWTNGDVAGQATVWQHIYLAADVHSEGGAAFAPPLVDRRILGSLRPPGR